MQFVPNGPDIPNALLQAHEEGKVVFFCGAGISYPAGLPGFKGLVDRIYSSIGTQPHNTQSIRGTSPWRAMDSEKSFGGSPETQAKKKGSHNYSYGITRSSKKS
mgnify:CR=1 FL=1